MMLCLVEFVQHDTIILKLIRTEMKMYRRFKSLSLSHTHTHIHTQYCKKYPIYNSTELLMNCERRVDIIECTAFENLRKVSYKTQCRHLIIFSDLKREPKVLHRFCHLLYFHWDHSIIKSLYVVKASNGFFSASIIQIRC